MTTFAGNIGVRTIEYETGTEVIERLLRRRIRRCKHAEDRHGNQD